MNFTHKVSIIIPVYNVIYTLERCARSLFEQTFSDIEFIFVDDCSTDNSLDKLKSIIELYPNRIPSIRILSNKKNEGISWTRYLGLQSAAGEYVIYVDSDDWVEPTMIAELYNFAKINNSDFVWCDFFIDFSNHLKQQVYKSQKQNECPQSLIISILKGEIHGSTCNKLIRRELCSTHQITFPIGINMCEDLYFNIQFLFKAKKINYYNKAFYHYIQQENSITYQTERLTMESQVKIIKLLENEVDTVTFVEAFDSYKSRVKSAYFLSGLFSKSEFENCFSELNNKRYQYPIGAINKLTIKIALRGFFNFARSIYSFAQYLLSIKEELLKFVDVNKVNSL